MLNVKQYMNKEDKISQNMTLKYWAKTFSSYCIDFA